MCLRSACHTLRIEKLAKSHAQRCFCLLNFPRVECEFCGSCCDTASTQGWISLGIKVISGFVEAEGREPSGFCGNGRLASFR